MTIPEKLRIEINKLEEIAEKIEEFVMELFTRTSLLYSPREAGIGVSPYRWNILPKSLKTLQSEAFGRYRGWYQSSRKLIEKYLKNDLKQFEFYYKNANDDNINNLIQLNVQVWKNNKRDIMKKFERAFSIQKNLVSSIKFLEISESLTFDSIYKNENVDYNNKIFIVHGHDEEMKASIEKVLKNFELAPIILHQQPNEGRTIIEKITRHSKVGAAIILLSPDDKCKQSEQQGRFNKTRARQNVIFEMGFFYGLLGRERVINLYREQNDFEFPSDYQGVLYIPYDNKDGWKIALVKELKSLGYSVDANRLD